MKKIKLVEFFYKEYDGPKRKIIVSSCTGSLCFVLLLVIVNGAAETASVAGAGTELWLLIIFLAICAIAITCKIYTLNQTTIMAEKAVRRVRLRLIDKIRHTELEFLETTGKGEIYARITQDTELISQASPKLINTVDAAFSCLGVFLYMMTISLTGFVLALGSITAMFYIFYSNYFKIKGEMKRARLKEADFFDLLNDTLSGFKEIKINTRKNNALFADIEDLAGEMEQITLDAELKFDKNIISANALFYMVLAVIIFAVPLLSNTYGDTVPKLVASTLFIFSLLGMVMSGTSVNVMANVAVENLAKLEASVDAFCARTAIEAPDGPVDFREIALHSVGFYYTGKNDETLFTLAPVDLTIRQGEVLFIVGGNGSGKSTLLKLLTGLYYPMANGRITVDHQTVTRTNYQAYRELFSIIFTDFHMFKKLYGLESVNVQDVRHLLKEMDIHTKTGYSDGKFDNIDLSTGQRKRLAYIAALLEDKPIYVFDEWAADQDPTFRRHFYEKFLEDLRAMNKTIIAVTHDDRYFGKADRVIKMEEGKVVEEGIV